MRMKWDPSMSTGVPALDEQHRALFAALNELVEAMAQGRPVAEVEAIAARVDQAVTRHFAHEELCMQQHRCPAAAANKQAHAEFAAMLADFRHRLGEHGPTPALVIVAERQLAGWLASHISRIDTQLAPCTRRLAS